MRRPGEREVIRIGGRKNKNEILGLTNARFVKEKHLNGVKYSRKRESKKESNPGHLVFYSSLGDIELVRGIHTNVKNGEFVLVLRTDGRIVAMSDEVEYHLNKSMVKTKHRTFIIDLSIILFLAFIIYSMYEYIRVS